MEGSAVRSATDRAYLVGLLAVVAVHAGAVVYNLATDVPVPQATVVSTVFLVACIFRIHGFRGALAFAALVIAIPFGSEFLGVLTGIPYGPYEYHAAPRPWILGLVPVFILIAWIHISYLAISTTTLGLGRSSPWLAPLDGVVAVAWDVLVDPLAVRAQYWIWLSPGGFYGVPLSNFLGWFLVVTALSFAIRRVWSRDARAPAQTSRTILSYLPVLLLASALQFGALAIADGLVLPALLGLGILLPAVALSWRRVASMPRRRLVPSHWVPPAAAARAEEASGISPRA